MRAIVLEKFGGLDSLVYKDIPEPEPQAGYVVIQIKAFGINHAEMHMRRGEWAEAAPVSGIECVGLVKIATTRNRERFSLLEKLGAERCEMERRDLSKHIAGAKKIDAVLDLVGNSVVLDSLAMLRRGGRSCLAGWLGGLDPIPDFNPLLQMPSGVHLTSFGRCVLVTSVRPLS